MLNAMRGWGEVRITQGAGGRREAFSTDRDQESFSGELTFELIPERTNRKKKKKNWV